MPNIQPFRTLNEYDIVNLYAYSGSLPVTKGTVVRIVGSGWDTTQEIQELGSVGASYSNTVSLRYGVASKVAQHSATGTACFGILLNDVREFDENGEKLIFNPRKAAEMQVAVSGQAVPIAVRGMFLYSGIAGAPTPGATAYATGDGGLSTTASATVHASTETVGKFLGVKNAQGHALVFLDF
jgi:hypothetical protein